MKSEVKRLYREIACLSRIPLRPLRVNLALTDACNLRCVTCSKWRGQPRTEELTGKEWTRILRSLKGFALTNLLVFEGAEPFCKSEFLEILKDSREMNFQLIVISNGTLIDRPAAEKLGRLGIRQMILSLNGVKPETHDKTRGVDGSFEKTMTAVRLLKENGVPVVLETVILRSNLGELEALVRLARENNLKGLLFQVLTSVNVHNKFEENRNRRPAPGWYRWDPEWIDDLDALDRVMTEIIRLKRKGFPVLNSLTQLRLFSRYYRDEESLKNIPCPCGYANFLVDPYGDVRLCNSMEPAGNLLEQEPLEIWRSERARRLRREIGHCQSSCRILNNNW